VTWVVARSLNAPPAAWASSQTIVRTLRAGLYGPAHVGTIALAGGDSSLSPAALRAATVYVAGRPTGSVVSEVPPKFDIRSVGTTQLRS